MSKFWSGIASGSGSANLQVAASSATQALIAD